MIWCSLAFPLRGKATETFAINVRKPHAKR